MLKKLVDAKAPAHAVAWKRTGRSSPAGSQLPKSLLSNTCCKSWRIFIWNTVRRKELAAG
ncbi:hypothetical protein [Mucilaginibacter gynuensis]|uniref:hypothetical protein n=1 Tax=Mucilaginibacter gynuensis TaxID=1302236 RepID=UPI0031EDF398